MLNRQNQTGLSLVEMMIAIVLGLFLVLGLVTFLVNYIKFNANTAKTTRLSQELRSTMEFMASDIRRAGSWGSAQLGTGAAPVVNPFSTITMSTPGCILYSYDQNLDGSLNSSAPDERFGFLLDSGAVKMRSGSTSYSCAVSSNWGLVTDVNSITVTALTFTVTSVAATSNARVIVRDVTISISGQIKNDPGMTQSLQQTVRIRNDLYV
jgi:type II secretory pathway component PulJ